MQFGFMKGEGTTDAIIIVRPVPTPAYALLMMATWLIIMDSVLKLGAYQLLP